MNNRQIEIAPGIYFIGQNGQYMLQFKHGDQDIIGWDFEEVKQNPQIWFDSLKAVALAVQYGPSVAFKKVRETRQERECPVGLLLCNICNKKVVVGPDYPYVFIAKLNGKSFHDYQCSQECHLQRKNTVYRTELGAKFIEEFPKVITRHG